MDLPTVTSRQHQWLVEHPRVNNNIIMPNERYIMKDGLVVDAETAERLGINGCGGGVRVVT